MYGLSGAVISAVDLIKGIGIYAGLKVIDVPGATGYLDTNYRGKAQAALDALRERDLVYVHVEAPDEAAHGGMLADKLEAIERFDAERWSARSWPAWKPSATAGCWSCPTIRRRCGA